MMLDARFRDLALAVGTVVVGLVAGLPLVAVLGAVLLGLVIMAVWLGAA
jgi:hypothetical protein